MKFPPNFINEILYRMLLLLAYLWCFLNFMWICFIFKFLLFIFYYLSHIVFLEEININNFKYTFIQLVTRKNNRWSLQAYLFIYLKFYNKSICHFFK